MAGGSDGEMESNGKVVDEDEDVRDERRRVLRGSGRRDLLQIKNLSKVNTSTLSIIIMMMMFTRFKILVTKNYRIVYYEHLL